MALTAAQMEKKILDLEKKVATLASSKELSDTENRLSTKIEDVKKGSGGTDSVVLSIQQQIRNINTSINSLNGDVTDIKKKVGM